MFLIISSSLVLAIDNPLDDPMSLQSQIISVLDIIFTILFSI